MAELFWWQKALPGESFFDYNARMDREEAAKKAGVVIPAPVQTPIWTPDPTPIYTPPPVVVSTPVTLPAAAPVVQVDYAKQARQAEKAAETGWDNIPEVRALQEESWNIYVDTGRWDNPRQLEIHQRAEDIRKATNPMYTGRPNGPVDAADAAKIALPTTQFEVANKAESVLDKLSSTSGVNGLLGVGMIALFGVVILSLLGRD